MPATYDTEKLVQTGFKAIVFFRGTLTSREEDLPSSFKDGKGNLQYQTKFGWDVPDGNILAFEAPVVLEDGTFRQFVTQKNTKNSTWGKMIVDWKNFADRQHLEGAFPDCLEGLDLIWARKEYPMGQNANPGMAYIPVDTGDNFKKYEKGLVEGGSIDTGADSDAKKGVKVPTEIDAKVEVAVLEIVDGGASAPDIKAVLTSKGPLRKGMATAGGVEPVIAYLVKSGKIVDTEGTYTLPEEDED